MYVTFFIKCKLHNQKLEKTADNSAIYDIKYSKVCVKFFLHYVHTTRAFITEVNV